MTGAMSSELVLAFSPRLTPVTRWRMLSFGSSQVVNATVHLTAQLLAMITIAL